MSKYYPDTLDMQAVNDLISFYQGNKPVPEVIESAWHVGGYALKQFVPVEQHPVGAACDEPVCPSDCEKIELFNAIKKSVDPGKVSAIEIPWAMVWLIIKQVIDKYIAG